MPTPLKTAQTKSFADAAQEQVSQRVHGTIADGEADPFVVAVDLLSQAEHGPESPAILVTTSTALGQRVLEHVELILPEMPTRDYAEPAWRDFGQVIAVDDLDEAFSVADSFAAEHVQVLTRDPRQSLEKMHDFGALFLGENTCVSYGDKGGKVPQDRDLQPAGSPPVADRSR